MFGFSKWFYLNTSNSYIHFTFEYEGGNISKTIQETKRLSRECFIAGNRLFRNSDPTYYTFIPDLFGTGGALCVIMITLFLHHGIFLSKVFFCLCTKIFLYPWGGMRINGRIKFTNSQVIIRVLKNGMGIWPKEYIYRSKCFYSRILPVYLNH